MVERQQLQKYIEVSLSQRHTNIKKNKLHMRNQPCQTTKFFIAVLFQLNFKISLNVKIKDQYSASFYLKCTNLTEVYIPVKCKE